MRIRLVEDVEEGRNGQIISVEPTKGDRYIRRGWAEAAPEDPVMSTGRRHRILRLGSNCLQLVFGRDTRGFYEVVKDGLPPDTRVVNAQMDSGFRTLLILLESQEFDPVPDDSPTPEIEPQFRTYIPPIQSTATNRPC